MDWEKAERLATIMYEEDKENYENGRSLVYFTEEDFKAEQAEREGKNLPEKESKSNVQNDLNNH